MEVEVEVEVVVGRTYPRAKDLRCLGTELESGLI